MASGFLAGGADEEVEASRSGAREELLELLPRAGELSGLKGFFGTFTLACRRYSTAVARWARYQHFGPDRDRMVEYLRQPA